MIHVENDPKDLAIEPNNMSNVNNIIIIKMRASIHEIITIIII